MSPELLTLFTAVAAGTLSVLAALGIWRWIEPAGAQAAALVDQTVEPMVLLFRDRQLVDATPPARTLLSKLHGDGDWPRLMAWLSMRCDALGPAFDALEAYWKNGTVPPKFIQTESKLYTQADDPQAIYESKKNLGY